MRYANLTFFLIFTLLSSFTQIQEAAGRATLGIQISQSGTAGVLITRVDPGSHAEKAGLRVNDEIIGVNGNRVTSLKMLALFMRNLRSISDLQLKITRKNSTLIIAVNPSKKTPNFVNSNNNQALKVLLDKSDVSGYCNWGGENDFSFGNSDSGGATHREFDFDNFAQRILDLSGLSKNFTIVKANVPNAMALIQGGNRIIAFNPQFLNQIYSSTGMELSVMSIVAHEIGHHLNGHTLGIGNNRHRNELEADAFSGYALASLGALPSEAVSAMLAMGNRSAGPSHPGTKERVEAITDGWIKWCKTDVACSRWGIVQDRKMLFNLPPNIAQMLKSNFKKLKIRR